jgi:hypothetical protein
LRGVFVNSERLFNGILGGVKSPKQSRDSVASGIRITIMWKRIKAEDDLP